MCSCLSCGDNLIDELDAFFVDSRHTDKPGYRCGECATELQTGMVKLVDQNIHICGAPATPKIDKLVYDWENE